MSTSVGVEAHAPGDAVGQDHPVLGVVAGQALAQVVEQRAHEQQVGPGDLADQLARLGHGLEEVAVHREPMEGVALRTAAYQLPLGEHPTQQAVPVERLELLERGPAAAEQRHEGVTDRVGPPLRERSETVPAVPQRRLRDRQALVGGGRRGARSTSSASTGTLGLELDLAVAHHDAGRDRALAVAPSGRPGRPHRAPRVVGLPADGATGLADPLHQLVGVDAEPSATGSCWSRNSTFEEPPATLELDPDLEQRVGRRPQRGRRRRDQARAGS